MEYFVKWKLWKGYLKKVWQPLVNMEETAAFNVWENPIEANVVEAMAAVTSGDTLNYTQAKGPLW